MNIPIFERNRGFFLIFYVYFTYFLDKFYKEQKQTTKLRTNDNR